MTVPKNKRQIGLRIPRELDNELQILVDKIGISKPAFILGLIYRELEKSNAGNVRNNINPPNDK